MTGFNRTGDDVTTIHSPSRPWLLFPILTTAFVIVGAWRRRAVRDAEVDAVDEQ